MWIFLNYMKKVIVRNVYTVIDNSPGLLLWHHLFLNQIAYMRYALLSLLSVPHMLLSFELGFIFKV